MTDRVYWGRETPLSNLRVKSHLIAHTPSWPVMINYWLQVDNVTKDDLLNTPSLCRDLKAPLSEPHLPLTASSLLPPSSPLPPPPLRAPPTQLLNGKVCLLPAFTTVSVYSKLLSLTWDALQLLLWGGLWLIHSRRVQYSTNPPRLQREASQRAHALENACGLINSISGGKTRLHPSHVVQENSLETCRQIAYKPPLGRMLLKTCDHKCVVVPDVVEHWAGFCSALFAPQEMHLDPKSHGGCGIQKAPRLGTQICHRAANITLN